MRTLSWSQVYARRLAASRLDVPAPRERLLDVARETCGVHAQLMSGAELALSARVEDVTRDDVRELLWERRALVKGSTIRGTLHLHPAAEYGVWKAARRAPEPWREEWWQREHDVTLAEAEYLHDAVLAVLDDGQPRTRGEIGAAIGGRLGAVLAGDSWGHYLAPANALMCHGPPRGRTVTFVRCDRWVPGWQASERTEALREVTRRYLETYGPARRDELEHWLYVNLPDDMLDELEEIDVEGYRTFVLPGTAFPDAVPIGVRLLSHYDVYVIACHPRSHLIPEQKERVFLRGGGPNPVLLVDGRVAGVWKRVQRGKRMDVSVEPFVKLTRKQRTELAEEAARVARTFGAEGVLVV